MKVPGERDFPSGSFSTRRDHLLREARGGDSLRRRFQLPAFKLRLGLAFAATLLVLIGAGSYALFGRAPDGIEPAGAAVRVEISSPEGGSKSTLINVLAAMRAREDNPAPEIAGGSPAQQQLLRSILGRMPGNSLTKVAIVPQPFKDLSGERHENGVALEFTALPGDEARSDWEESILSGAFRDLSVEKGLPPVFLLSGPQTGYSPTLETASEIEAKILTAASDAGAKVIQLQIYQPSGVGAAPAVILQVDDPASFMEHRLPGFLDAIGNSWLVYEGSYVEIIDGDGAFAWEYGTSSLAGSGSTGSRPDLEGCNPIHHGWLTVQGPPPCPAS